MSCRSRDHWLDAAELALVVVGIPETFSGEVVVRPRGNQGVDDVRRAGLGEPASGRAWSGRGAAGEWLPSRCRTRGEHHKGQASDAAGAAGGRGALLLQKVPVPRLELTNTQVGLAVLPGSFCLVTFRIRSGKETQMGSHARRYQVPI
jgi:hypothetical protein